MYNPIQSREKTQSNISAPIEPQFNDNDIPVICHERRNELHKKALQKSKRWLYLAHFCAHFSDNYWNFSVVLFLSALEENQSLILISTFGLSHSLGTVIFTPKLGRWVDQRPKYEELRTIRLVLASKYTVIVLLAVVCSWTLATSLKAPSHSASENMTNLWWVLGVVGIHILGTASQVLYQTFKIIIERELVVILSLHAKDMINISQSRWLSETNATLSRIGLVAPLTISFLVLQENLQLACLFMFLVAVLSAFVENHCYSIICQHLQECPMITSASPTNELELLTEFASTDSNETLVTAEDQINIHNTSLETKSSLDDTSSTCSCTTIQDMKKEDNTATRIRPHLRADNSMRNTNKKWALQVYFQQAVAPAGICLALLYANCITFGNGILSTFLLSQGLGAARTGLFRGISSAVGLLVGFHGYLDSFLRKCQSHSILFQGTGAYTLSLRHHSLDFTGTWGVGLQALCLAISTWFILVSKEEDCFLYSAIAFICISRLGLWVIEITVTQLQQQEIPEEYRCLMGGVQEAINACFHVIAFVFGLLFPDPNDFFFISLSGCLFVSLAFVVFFFGMYLPRRKKQTPEFILPNTNHSISIT